ncbi:MAG: Latent nuclear antigen [Parcubacteria group bacterium Gr01-1014_13]|nr:MAG: Latent nuclear antigen [Parcubacteria group bacterium Gr01-1014_13]
MKNIAKILVLSFLFTFAFTAAKPAKAFYLEVPASVKGLLSIFKSRQSIAQESGTMTPMPMPTNMTYPTDGGTQQYQQPMPMPSGDMSQYPMQGTQQYPMPSGDMNQQYPMQGTQQYPMPPSGDMNQQPMPYTGMMSSSGQYPMQGTQQYPDMKQPGMMPPSGDQYKQYPDNKNMMQGDRQGMPYGDQREGMQGDQRMGDQGQDSGKQLEQMKRSMKQMGRMVKQFDSMIASAEKKGTSVPEEIKQNLAKLKSILEAVQNAKSMEELQDVDMNSMQDLTQSLEDFRRNVMEAQQRLDGMKRGMKGMEQALKMFKSQIARLTKQKVVVPTEVTENIAKLEEIITTIKNAKTAEEMDAIDFESMQDLMQTMDQNRQQLEMLARWPQALKQIDRQLTQLNSALKQSKIIVDRLAKKGTDLQAEYAAFAEAVAKLKIVRDDAVAKMAAGSSEEAFSALEDDFFGQMEDVWQHQRVIMMVSNLGRFASEFKRGVAEGQATINKLKRKKIDTSELVVIFNQAKEKGQEILNLLKAKPLDMDAITGAMDELENITQEFDSKASELGGEEERMPWEEGPQQFRRVDLPQGFDKFVPQRQEAQTSQSTETQTQTQ